MVLATIMAGAVALLAHPLPHNLGLIVASLSGIAAGIFFEKLGRRRKEEIRTNADAD